MTNQIIEKQQIKDSVNRVEGRREGCQRRASGDSFGTKDLHEAEQEEVKDLGLELCFQQIPADRILQPVMLVPCQPRRCRWEAVVA